jgi:antitoxin component of MazEF toxin-antitoxin module
MTTAVVKSGSSLRLPKNLLENINVSENDTVEVLIANNSIIIRKPSAKHRTTKERLIEFYGIAIADSERHPPSEIDWGKPVGEELW